MTAMREAYEKIRERIKRAADAAGRNPEATPITLLAVSKTQPVEKIEALYRLGHRDFGENYVQELVSKARELEKRGCEGIRWHFIGHLQTNKVKLLIPFVSSVHSVDSARLARELDRRWAERKSGMRLPVFLEVNLSGEASKSGVAPSALSELAREVGALPELSLQGLMCIPDPSIGSEETRAAFRRLRELEEGCRSLGSQGKLSMGMSGDFELAIAEGATHIRVGTALFGARGQN